MHCISWLAPFDGSHQEAHSCHKRTKTFVRIPLKIPSAVTLVGNHSEVSFVENNIWVTFQKYDIAYILRRILPEYFGVGVSENGTPLQIR